MAWLESPKTPPGALLPLLCPSGLNIGIRLAIKTHLLWSRARDHKVPLCWISRGIEAAEARVCRTRVKVELGKGGSDGYHEQDTFQLRYAGQRAAIDGGGRVRQ